MPIIIPEILKILNEREKYDTRCAIMRWSGSEV